MTEIAENKNVESKIRPLIRVLHVDHPRPLPASSLYVCAFSSNLPKNARFDLLERSKHREICAVSAGNLQKVIGEESRAMQASWQSRAT